jgi:DUF1365 family protein
MAVEPKLILADIYHKRFFPRINIFNYKCYYLLLPLSLINQTGNLTNNLSINKFAKMSFYESDHGVKNNQQNCELWIRSILIKHDNSLNDMIKEIYLLTMPRILGYIFNPVSFWFCTDDKDKIRAVLCEVNNTFGERHFYFCSHKNNEIIKPKDLMYADKIFHVSPFLKREGRYSFRFSFKHTSCGVWIDYFDRNGQKKLVTSISGKCHELSKKNINSFFWKYPLITIKTILLIHWQALKLKLKGIKYITKPEQIKQTLSNNIENKYDKKTDS